MSLARERMPSETIRSTNRTTGRWLACSAEIGRAACRERVEFRRVLFRSLHRLLRARCECRSRARECPRRRSGPPTAPRAAGSPAPPRSEERRVGKEWSSDVFSSDLYTAFFGLDVNVARARENALGDDQVHQPHHGPLARLLR